LQQPRVDRGRLGEDLGDSFELLSDVVLFDFAFFVCAVEGGQVGGDAFLFLGE
jgi:hypothetical protein